MVNEKFWDLVKEFNILMRSAIEGPNCLNVCNGDCCSIKIDVPRVLAEEYIRRGYANKEDFIRSDNFSFTLRFDEEKGKCFLFDKSLNGCTVHASGIKPPQCWIYPTRFSNPNNEPLSCKKLNGWKIIDTKKTKEAEKLLKYYVFLCQLEAKREVKNISKRIINSLQTNSLICSLRASKPAYIAGFKDTWDNFKILSAEGLSLQLKKFCQKYNESCEYLTDKNFLGCNKLCKKVIEGLIKFLQQNINKYVKEKGPSSDGKYPFFKLHKFNKKRSEDFIRLS
ncbi:MAG: YkgJ family cysteine cluster protein [Promethearchaeota archaeon]